MPAHILLLLLLALLPSPTHPTTTATLTLVTPSTPTSPSKPYVLVCADSRSSRSTFVSSSRVLKILPVSPTTLSTMAGGAADCYYVLQSSSSPPSLPLRSTAVEVSDYLFRTRGLTVGTVISAVEGGLPTAYYVDSEGTRERVTFRSVGSGSTTAQAMMEDFCRLNPPPAGLEGRVGACCEVGAGVVAIREAVVESTRRDGYSGGVVQVYVVEEGGWWKEEAVDWGDDAN